MATTDSDTQPSGTTREDARAEGYEPAEVSRAKDVVLQVLHARIDDEHADFIEVADEIVTDLTNAGAAWAAS